MPGFNRITTVFLAAGCLLLSSCSQSPPPEDQLPQAQPNQNVRPDGARFFDAERREITPYEFAKGLSNSFFSVMDEHSRYDLKQRLTPQEFNSLSLFKRRALNSAKADTEPERRQCIVGVDPLTNRRLSLLETVQQIRAEELAELSPETKGCLRRTLKSAEFAQLAPSQQEALPISTFLP